MDRDDEFGTESTGRGRGRSAGDDAHPAANGVAATAGVNRVVAGRYEILEAMGEGPFLLAFRARDRALNRIVVVKTLRPELAGDAAVAEHLRAGLSAVLSLSHPALTRVYDVDGEGGALFLAEEYVRGIDLKERIRRVAPFSLTAATDVALALAEALEYAHARGVVHGDLRPANVLIGPEGNVKLTGLGASGTRPLLPDASAGARTAPYAPPEGVQRRAPTFSADLYALGAILFEMLTGDLPYGGADDPDHVTLRHARDPLPSPRALNPGVPSALDGIVCKALARGPHERYGSASEMIADLRAVRDALRQGGSLSWSPLDRAAAPVFGGAAEVPSPLPDGRPMADTTIVMPAQTQVPKKRTPSRPPTARQPNPSPAPGGNRWLLSLNLFLFALVLAGAAGLAYMTLNFVQAPSDVIVPNLVGRRVREAEALAKDRKFALSVVDERYMDNKKFPAETIYRMDPEPGRHIRAGKPVKIWVSKGPRLVVVPDVRDMAVEGAKRALENAGLRLGQRSYQFDPLVAKGNVLSQLPDAGESEPRGKAVNLVLSKGEEPPPPPIYVPATEPDVSAPASVEAGAIGGGNDTGGNAGDRVRLFTIRYPIPNDGVRHRIRIDVTDKDGTRTIYDEERDGGERIQEEIEGVGRRVTIKLFDNDELRSEQTK